MRVRLHELPPWAELIRGSRMASFPRKMVQRHHRSRDLRDLSRSTLRVHPVLLPAPHQQPLGEVQPLLRSAQLLAQLANVALERLAPANLGLERLEPLLQLAAAD